MKTEVKTKERLSDPSRAASGPRATRTIIGYDPEGWTQLSIDLTAFAIWIGAVDRGRTVADIARAALEYTGE